jgi:hypothetical protein
MWKIIFIFWHIVHSSFTISSHESQAWDSLPQVLLRAPPIHFIHGDELWGPLATIGQTCVHSESKYVTQLNNKFNPTWSGFRQTGNI